MKLKLLAVSALFMLTTNIISAQYVSTGQLINPNSISNEGLIVGGNGFAQPYMIWDATANSFETIGGITAGQGHGGRAIFSENGKYISGTSESTIDPANGEMSRYNVATKEWQTLGSFANNNGFTGDFSSGFAISGDGKTVAGMSFNSSYKSIGFIWNESKGAMGLESMNPSRNSRVNTLSSDASTAVGYQDMQGAWKASVWKRKSDGTYGINKLLLVDPNGDSEDTYNQLGEANAVSADGKWIGGKSDFAFENAWIWSEETGVIDLGNLTSAPIKRSYVNSMSPDGSIVFGNILTLNSNSDITNYEPYIWTEKDGMVDFNDFVKNVLGYDIGNDKIYSIQMVSSNLKYVLAWGKGDGMAKTMRIQLPDNFLTTNEVNSSVEATLYPNPVNNVLNIDAKEMITEVSVYNLTGQKLSNKLINKKTSTIDMSNLKSGVYIVEVNYKTSTKTYKVIKK